MRMQCYRRNLHAWVSALPTPTHDIKVGPPLRSGQASAEGQRDFQQLAQSIADQISRSTKGHQILTATTNSPWANAVAFRGGMAPNVHVVIATNSLIRRMQEISAGCLEATLTQLADPSDASVLKKIWGELPVDRNHAQGFAQLLTHVAFVLVMNHELAHVVIGHGFVKRVGWVDEARELMDFTSINFATAPLLSTDNQHSLIFQSQSMELDADLHALAWTNDYLCRFDRESESIKALGNVVEDVCNKVLFDQTGRRFVLIVAAWIMFLALGGSEFDAEMLKIGSHPPTGVRLALLLHAEHQFAANCDSQAVALIEAAAYGALAGANGSLGGFTPTQIAENIGFNGARRNWGSVAAHFGALAITRRSLEDKLLPHRITTGLPRVDWY